MSDKILDCSKLSEAGFDAIKNGYDKFVKPSSRLRYFGYVDKRDMKDLCRNFRYTDKRSFVKGGVAVAGLYWLGKKVKKYLDSTKTEPVEETVPNEEES